MVSYKNKNVKTIVSLAIGIPAAVIVMCDLSDLTLWWLQFAAAAIAAGLLWWNGAFQEG